MNTFQAQHSREIEYDLDDHMDWVISPLPADANADEVGHIDMRLSFESAPVDFESFPADEDDEQVNDLAQTDPINPLVNDELFRCYGWAEKVRSVGCAALPAELSSRSTSTPPCEVLGVKFDANNEIQGRCSDAPNAGCVSKVSRATGTTSKCRGKRKPAHVKRGSTKPTRDPVRCNALCLIFA